MKNKPGNPKLHLGGQAIAAALAFGAGNLHAQTLTSDCNEQNSASCEEVEHIQVHGIRDSIYKVDQSGDARRVADLVDTPQVITVLTQDQIQESGQTDLKEILSAQAGVTLGTGENGNAFGDRYIIRGHEARSDVFVDGMRDPGMTTRESFATERVEITKGPSSTFAGRGSSGGAVNSVTKKASSSYNFGRVDASVGSDDYIRLTADYNAAINDDAAVRINLLSASETKPGREGIDRERTGLQLSSSYQVNEQLSFVADVYYLDAADKPDLGSYFDQTTRKPLEDIPVYAQEEDFMDSEVTTFTLSTEYAFSDSLRLTNATRIGKTENGYVTTGMRGTTRDITDPTAPEAYTLSLSTHQGWQEVDYTASQTNVFLNRELFGFNNQFVFGFEYTDEKVANGVFDITYAGDTNCITAGRRGASESYCLLDGQGNSLTDVNNLMQRSFDKGIVDALHTVKTTSFYAMDTVDVTEQTKVFFGYRLDSFDYKNDVTSTRTGDFSAYEFSDSMHNGHFGIVQEVLHDFNVYVSYSTATNINGGESDLGASCGYGGICGDPEQASMADPETVENVELGAKWLINNDSLMLTASLFQMTKSDVMESVGDSYSTLGTLNTGENEISGIELGAAGDITDKLSIQLSAAVMESEVTKSFNEETVGLALSNFAENSVYLQLRYELNDDFSFGGDMTYQSEMYGGQPDTAAGYDTENGRYSIVVPEYTVFNLFANYNVSEDFTVRANIGNVLDEEYWTAAYRSGAFMYLGDGQNARVTVNYQF